MAKAGATYALCQPFSCDALSHANIMLGTILPRTATQPWVPDTSRPLNRLTRVPVPETSCRVKHDRELYLDRENLRSGSAGVFSHLPFEEFVDRSSSEGSTEKLYQILARNVETKSFLPDAAYLAQALQDEAVEAEILSYRRPSIFLVTGIKTAGSARIISEHNDLNLVEWDDVTCLPIGVATARAERGGCNERSLNRPFVLAVETRRICRKSNGFLDELPLVTEDLMAQLDCSQVVTVDMKLDEYE